MSPSVRRALLTIGAVLLFVVLAGATYQGVATALERRQYPHPGRLIDVGGHQLHLHCEGRGTPIVVLEAPATAMSSAWAWVQADVSKITRVCSYDRAGLGWSEAGDAPFAPVAVPTELHTLLRLAGENTSPEVLVGADLGAAYASIYASTHPDDVAALVLINPPGPSTSPRSLSVRFITVSPWLARTGLLRAARTLSKRAAGLPQPAAGALASFLNRPDHLTRAASELSQWGETVGMADAAQLRVTVPVTRVELQGDDIVAALADRGNAQDVTNAVSGAVASVRALRSR